MRLRLGSFKYGRLPALCVLALAAGLSGCGAPMMEVEEVLETTSCTDDAVAMQALVSVNGTVTDVQYLGGSSNVIPTPTVIPSTNSFRIVANLAAVNLGDAVTLKYKAKVATSNQFVISTSNFFFYTQPWGPDEPPTCLAGQGPRFEVSTDVLHDLRLRVSSDGPLPIEILSLELVSTNPLPASQLDWSSPDLNGLPWSPAVPAPGGVVLAPGAPPMEIDLPDVASGPATLCRFTSMYDGHLLRGIVQVKPAFTIGVEPRTWSNVKAAYR